MAAGGAGFELAGVSVRYGAHAALDGVDLAVAPGERVALVGPSGAGKTTLLRLLNAMARPTAGRVLVDGRDLSRASRRELRELRARIGFVHQDLALVPNLRVSQNVLSGALGRHGFLGGLRLVFLPRRADLDRAFGLLGEAGIPEKLFERTDHLSGGQQQRVAIARALMPGPAVLLADEPVSSVDPARAEDTVGLLTDLSIRQGLTLLMSLHNIELARRHFPRLVGLKAGRVAFDAAAAQVRDEDVRDLYRLAKGELLADGS